LFGIVIVKFIAQFHKLSIRFYMIIINICTAIAINALNAAYYDRNSLQFVTLFM